MGATIFVIGHRGMLGTAVRRYLGERGHRILTTDRRFEGSAADPMIAEVALSGADVIVNCAAALPSSGATPSEMLVSNALLPLRLMAGLHAGRLLIHASTDGVFSDTAGNCAVGHRPDATDPYGLSKRVGELVTSVGRAVVIRASIVGTSGGLLRWLMAQRGDVTGYTDQLWNGVPLLEWARVCAEMIDERSADQPGLVHLTSRPPISKFELLDIAAQVLDARVRVHPAVSGRLVTRILEPTIERGGIREQLRELRRWEGN